MKYHKELFWFSVVLIVAGLMTAGLVPHRTVQDVGQGMMLYGAFGLFLSASSFIASKFL